MRIDISSEDVALGYARRLMKKADRDPKDIVALTQAVFGAGSAKEAREAITEATFGSIEFYDSRRED